MSYVLTHKKEYIRSGSNINERERESQYECGIEPIEEEIGKETKERFNIKYYKVAIIFLIFDLEAILLYPFTLINRTILTETERICTY